jgi:hypothetical protein
MATALPLRRALPSAAQLSVLRSVERKWPLAPA